MIKVSEEVIANIPSKLRATLVSFLKSDGNCLGTGFFISENQVLTCAHVVDDQDFTIDSPYTSTEIELVSMRIAPKCDLAVVTVTPPSSDWLAFSRNFSPGDSLFIHGFPASKYMADSASGIIEGTSITRDFKSYLKFRSTQIIPGFSGAPAWSDKEQAVYGVVCLTRDRKKSAGGRCIPTAEIESSFGDLTLDIKGDRMKALSTQMQTFLTRVSMQLKGANDTFLLSNWKGGQNILDEYEPVGCYDELGRYQTNALNALIEWTHRADLKHVIIVGDFGIGKTFLLQRYLVALLNEGSNLRPLYIAIRDLKSRDSNDLMESLFQLLRNRYRIELHDYFEFEVFAKENSLVLILDGLDELVNSSEIGSGTQSLKQIAPIANLCHKVVLTSRWSDSSASDFLSSGIPASVEPFKLASILSQGNSISQLIIANLSFKQKRAFINKYCPSKSTRDWLLRRIGQFGVFDDLASRPGTLRMLVKSAALMPAGTHSVSSLYRMEIQAWLEQNSQQPYVKIPIALKYRCLKEVGFYMWNKGVDLIGEAEFLEFIEDYLKNPNFSDVQVSCEFASSAFLLITPDGYFTFTHRAFQEYLVASKLIDSFESTNSPIKTEIHITPLVRKFVCELLEESPLRGDIEGQLLSALEEKRSSSLSLSNIASILVNTGEDLSGMNLAGTDLSNSDLRKGVFVGSNLDGCSLAGANLAGANFSDASLKDVQFENVFLDKTDFNNACLDGSDFWNLRLVGGPDTIWHLAPFRTENGLFLVCRDNGEITLIDLVKEKSINLLNKQSSPTGILNATTNLSTQILAYSTRGHQCFLVPFENDRLVFSERVKLGSFDNIRWLSFEHSSNKIAACSRDGIVKVVKLKEFVQVIQIFSGKAPLMSVQWLSVDFLVSGGYDGILRIHRTNSPIRTWEAGGARNRHPGVIRAILVVGRSNVVISADEKGWVKFWAYEDSSRLKPLRNIQIGSGVFSIAECSMGYYFGCADGCIRLYSNDFEELACRKVHRDIIRSVLVFREESHYILSASWDGKVMKTRANLDRDGVVVFEVPRKQSKLAQFFEGASLKNVTGFPKFILNEFE